MAGFVPAIPNHGAQPCHPKRGHRDKPGDDKLMRNRAGNFSVGRLLEFLTALGQDVKITVKPARKKQGEMWGGPRIGLVRDTRLSDSHSK
jgi:hypothetical protein